MNQVSTINKYEVLEILRDAGYHPRRLSNIGYEFVSEEFIMLYLTPPEECSTLIFSIPKIYIISPNENPLILRKLVNELNASILGVKFTIMDDQVWANYEYYVTDSLCPAPIISHMIKRLKNAVRLFQERIQNY